MSKMEDELYIRWNRRLGLVFPQRLITLQSLSMIANICVAIPEDIFCSRLLPFLSVPDVIRLDSAWTAKNSRAIFHSYLTRSSLIGDVDHPLNAPMVRWLIRNRKYLSEMYLDPSLHDYDFHVVNQALKEPIAMGIRYNLNITPTYSSA